MKKRSMKRACCISVVLFSAIAVTALVLLTASLPAWAADYDLVILNGRVMDPETMLDAVRNIGIKDGKIAVITTEAIAGKDILDAAGLVVAPGFIDTHVHSSNKFNIKMVMMDGVTSGMDFEAGALNVGPVVRPGGGEVSDQLRHLHLPRDGEDEGARRPGSLGARRRVGHVRHAGRVPEGR